MNTDPQSIQLFLSRLAMLAHQLFKRLNANWWESFSSSSLIWPVMMAYNFCKDGSFFQNYVETKAQVSNKTELYLIE